MSYHESNPTHHDDDWADGQVLGFDDGDTRGELKRSPEGLSHKSENPIDSPNILSTFTPEQQETEQELWLREASWAIRNMIQNWADTTTSDDMKSGDW